MDQNFIGANSSRQYYYAFSVCSISTLCVHICRFSYFFLFLLHTHITFHCCHWGIENGKKLFVCLLQPKNTKRRSYISIKFNFYQAKKHVNGIWLLYSIEETYKLKWKLTRASSTRLLTFSSVGAIKIYGTPRFDLLFSFTNSKEKRLRYWKLFTSPFSFMNFRFFPLVETETTFSRAYPWSNEDWSGIMLTSLQQKYNRALQFSIMHGILLPDV